MRKFTTTIVMMMAMALSMFAQVPQTMSYQAVVRNAENAIVASQSVSIELSILQGSDEGTAVYTETHNATTNANGLITLELGAGESSDNFSAIDWSAGPYFVKTVAEIDGKQVTGVAPMLVVPYAKYAETAGNVPDMSEYAKKSDIPADVDLSNYATKSELPSLEGYAKTEDLPDMSEYAKKSDIPVDVDLSNYATKSDIPSLEGYAKTEDLPDMSEYTKTADLPTVDLSGYAKTSEIADMATKTYVDGKVAAVEVPTTVAELTDAADYAKTSDVSLAITTATTDMATKTYVDDKVAAVEVPTTVAELTDAADYAKMSEVSSAIAIATTDMATKTYVDGKVAAVEVPTTVVELTDAADYAKTSDVSLAITTATTDMATKTYVDGAVAAVEVPTTVAELTDAADYAKTSEVSSAIATATTDMATKTYVDGKVAAVEVPTTVAELTDAGDYAKTSDVSSAIATATTDMATQTYVDGKVAAVEVPTKVSDLTDAADYAKTSEVSSAIATATTDMATKTYVDGKVAAVEVPTTVAELTDAADYANVQADWIETDNTKDSYIKNKPALATVATSGSYEDLSNKPTIPDVTGFATKKELEDYAKVSDLPDMSKYTKTADLPTVPTKVSDLTDAADYAKTSHVNSAISVAKTYVDSKVAAVNVPTKVSDLTDAADYAKTSYVNSAISVAKTYVDDKVAAVEVPTTVAELTDAGDYAKKTDIKEVDLSGYYKKSDVDALLAESTAKIKQLNRQLKLLIIKDCDCAIQAAFSISADDQVYFSQGNLQYQASTNTWRFAENQYDIIGDNNSNISSTYSGWIDLFGWGTSGWNSGANAYQPYSTSTEYEDYYPGGSSSNNLTGSYANADWGVYNKISNGGNTAGVWRTLTNNEWRYLLNTRTGARTLRGFATVNGVKGLILLPDDWTTPSGITFTSRVNGYDSNTYTTSDWAKMEANGAVFLPAAGERDGSKLIYKSVGFYGYYWSSSVGGNYDNVDCLYFNSDIAGSGNEDRSRGLSVRLVLGL